MLSHYIFIVILSDTVFVYMQLSQNNDRYSNEIQQYIKNLYDEINITKFAEDGNHVLYHQPPINYKTFIKCNRGNKCKHLQRANRTQNVHKPLQEKQNEFNCDGWKDFGWISYLDRLHTKLLHEKNTNISEDSHKIETYSKFPVYSTGVFIQYDRMFLIILNLRLPIFYLFLYQEHLRCILI